MNEQKNELKKVTNCWTIYTSNTEDSDIAQIGRPQDWGNPKWMYRVYVLEAQGYRNEVHCWIDKQVNDHEHLLMFSGMICTITLPGWTPELSGKDYMDEDDFWDESWGAMPPFYDEYEEEE